MALDTTDREVRSYGRVVRFDKSVINKTLRSGEGIVLSFLILLLQLHPTQLK